jgi:hypothetical protein
VKTTIYTLLKALIGSETLIWGNQNAPEPPLPYWTVIIQTTRRIGSDAYSQGVDDDGNQTVFGVRAGTIALQRYGTDSELKCADVRDALAKISVIESFSSAGLEIYDVGPINDTTITQDASIRKPRASMDVMVRFGTKLLDEVGIIQTAITDAEYTNLDDDGNTDEITTVLY